MAAVIDLRTGTAVPQHRPVPPPRPRLTVLEGGRSAAALHRRRTYLRRRVLAAAAALVVVLAVAAGLVTAVGALTGPSVAEVPTEVHTVRAGDTLWSIAAAIDPDADPRDVVDRIADLNAGASGSWSPNEPLRIGQALRVPVGG